jgi:transmembrane sensor
MEDKALNELLERYRAGKATPEDMAFLESWYLNYNRQAYIMDDTEREVDVDLIWAAVRQENRLPAKAVKLWLRLAVVAAAVALIVFGVYFFSVPRHPELVSGSPLANDIAPGKNSAIITLVDGTVIPLSDLQSGVVIGEEKLVYDDGSEIKQPSLPKGISPGGRESNRMLTASTPRGGTYIVTLPDGTKVWLNADSKLEFPSKFGKNEKRIVRLSGEGYFEVVHNAKQPFRVESRGQVVEDIGTAFNINAYGDEVVVRTTLVEGSARVTSIASEHAPSRHPEFISGSQNRKGGDPGLRRDDGAEGENRVILKPNQQAVVSGSNRITMASVDAAEAVAWKNGKFVFNDQDITSIMRMLSRWYNVEVIYQGDFKGKTFDGSISRYDNISKILEKIALTQTIHFKIEGRRITVMP